ncbi:MAG: Imm61 family immunity protein [Mycobacterium sp.]
MSDSAELSVELLDWARRAGYTLTAADREGVLTLWSDPGGEVRYYLRRREDGWYLLTRSSRDSDEQFVLAAVSREILERFLYGVFGTVIRDDHKLPFLQKPWNPADVASGYSLSEMSEGGYRTLSRMDSGPVAVAREKTISLMNLVPLSHFLKLSISELEASYLSDSGGPLLSGRSYTSRNS